MISADAVYAERGRAAALLQIDRELEHARPLLASGLPNPAHIYLTRRKATGHTTLPAQRDPDSLTAVQPRNV
jgi:hypothetical protein